MFKDPRKYPEHSPLERFYWLYDTQVGASEKTDELRMRLTLTPTNRKQREENGEYLQERLSALRATLSEVVKNQILLARIGGRPAGTEAKGRFGLSVTPEEIAIEE